MFFKSASGTKDQETPAAAELQGRDRWDRWDRCDGPEAIRIFCSRLAACVSRPSVPGGGVCLQGAHLYSPSAAPLSSPLAALSATDGCCLLQLQVRRARPACRAAGTAQRWPLLHAHKSFSSYVLPKTRFVDFLNAHF